MADRFILKCSSLVDTVGFIVTVHFHFKIIFKLLRIGLRIFCRNLVRVAWLSHGLMLSWSSAQRLRGVLVPLHSFGMELWKYCVHGNSVEEMMVDPCLLSTSPKRLRMIAFGYTLSLGWIRNIFLFRLAGPSWNSLGLHFYCKILSSICIYGPVNRSRDCRALSTLALAPPHTLLIVSEGSGENGVHFWPLAGVRAQKDQFIVVRIQAIKFSNSCLGSLLFVQISNYRLFSVPQKNFLDPVQSYWGSKGN